MPIYYGETNIEKLDNQIKKLELYCRIQNIVDESAKIQLATLRMGGTSLIWWESKTQSGLKHKGKIISSWSKFVRAFRNQFYALVYVQQAIMDWQYLRQGKGQSVQEFTQVLRKNDLALVVPLDTLDTFLKYIGSFHSYLQHTLLMFNPTKFDEVYVQAIHIESGGRPFQSNFSKKPFKNSKRKYSKE